MNMNEPVARRHVPLSKAIADYLVEMVMAVLPHDGASNRVKASLLRWRGADVGQQIKLWRGVWVADPQQLTVGDGVTVGKDVMFISVGPIRIDDRAMIGHGSKLITAGHGIPDNLEAMRTAEPVVKSVVIEKDAWLGAQVLVMPGVTVGEGAVVAAGAVVTKDVEPYTIVGGVPARLIRRRE